jgi:hypothetical protein
VYPISARRSNGEWRFTTLAFILGFLPSSFFGWKLSILLLPFFIFLRLLRSSAEGLNPSSSVLYFPPSSEIFSGRLKPLILRSLSSSSFWDLHRERAEGLISSSSVHYLPPHSEISSWKGWRLNLLLFRSLFSSSFSYSKKYEREGSTLLRVLTLGPLYPKEGPSSSSFFHRRKRRGRKLCLYEISTPGPLYPKEGPSSSSVSYSEENEREENMLLQNLTHEPPYPPPGAPFLLLILAREEGEQGEEEEGI